MARATPTVLASETEGAVSVPIIFVGDIRITRPHALCFHVSGRCSALIRSPFHVRYRCYSRASLLIVRWAEIPR